MKIEIYGAATTKSQYKDQDNAFLRYVKSPAGQTILGENGYRPVDKKVFAQFKKSFPVRPAEVRIDNKFLGGWRASDAVGGPLRQHGDAHQRRDRDGEHSTRTHWSRSRRSRCATAEYCCPTRAP